MRLWGVKGEGERAGSFTACFIVTRYLFDQLTTHRFRDGAPFLRSQPGQLSFACVVGGGSGGHILIDEIDETQGSVPAF